MFSGCLNDVLRKAHDPNLKRKPGVVMLYYKNYRQIVLLSSPVLQDTGASTNVISILCFCSEWTYQWRNSMGHQAAWKSLSLCAAQHSHVLQHQSFPLLHRGRSHEAFIHQCGEGVSKSSQGLLRSVPQVEDHDQRYVCVLSFWGLYAWNLTRGADSSWPYFFLLFLISVLASKVNMNDCCKKCSLHARTVGH